MVRKPFVQLVFVVFSSIGCFQMQEKATGDGSVNDATVYDAGLEAKPIQVVVLRGDSAVGVTTRDVEINKVNDADYDTVFEANDSAVSNPNMGKDAQVDGAFNPGIGAEDDPLDAGLPRLTVTGHISYEGKGLEGVGVILYDISTLNVSTTTDRNGDYFFTEGAGRVVKIAPEADDYIFTPESQRVGLSDSGETIESVDFEAEAYVLPEYATGMWKVAEYAVCRMNSSPCTPTPVEEEEGEVLEFTDGCLYEGSKCVQGLTYYSRVVVPDPDFIPYPRDTGQWRYTTEGQYDEDTGRWTISRTETFSHPGSTYTTTIAMVLERIE